MMEQKIVFGCIADDFTGASDAASFLVKGGMPTVLYNGVPDAHEQIPQGVTAAVIALKTRTEETALAVEQSLQAAKWLQEKGAQQLYVKYCSTFDSTPRGNIGPICDAILDSYNIPYTVLCPSLPVNKRTVQNGTLYVDGVPLAETHMKNHPLTPMWDSYIPNLMKEQSRYPCLVLGSQELQQTDDEILQQLADFSKHNPPFYVIPDFADEQQGRRIAKLFGSLALLTGGSGLMQPIAQRHNSSKQLAQHPGGSTGKALIVAGSCSVATRGQVAHYLAQGGMGIMVYPHRLLTGEQTAEQIWQQIAAAEKDHVLVYSAGSAGETQRTPQHNQEALLLEQTLSELARRAEEAGFTRIISAGGETSGAVTKALGYNAYQIGQSIAPGVPVMIPLTKPRVRLVLKSGNFGQPDFFTRALEITSEER